MWERFFSLSSNHTIEGEKVDTSLPQKTSRSGTAATWSVRSTNPLQLSNICSARLEHLENANKLRRDNCKEPVVSTPSNLLLEIHL